MHILALIKYIAVLVMAFMTTAAEKTVKLKITTTSCESSCKEVHNEACPASIKLNEREMSDRKDGFNILVLDSYTGNVKKRKHIKYFNDPIFWRRAKFKNFFKSLTPNSTVIITFQNMCKTTDSNWYSYLSGLDHTITRKVNSRQVIVVACKGTCPRGIGEKIPYTYQSSSGVSFEKTITLVFTGGRTHSNNRNRLGTYEPDIPAIACGVAAAIVLVTLFYACFLYYRQRTTPDDNYYISFHENPSRGVSPGQDHTCKNTSNEQAEPIYEEIAHTNIYSNNNNNPSASRGGGKEQRYHVPELQNANQISANNNDPGATTLASAPPLSLYVSMDQINEHCYSNVSTATTQAERNNLL